MGLWPKSLEQPQLAEAACGCWSAVVGCMSAKRILIIDDNEALLEMITNEFTAEGYEVDSACEREEAEALLNHVDYDLVITDLALTKCGFGGLDILEILAQRRARPKVVVLTGHGAPEIQVEACTRGADAFLKKPIPIADIVRLVGMMVEA